MLFLCTIYNKACMKGLHLAFARALFLAFVVMAERKRLQTGFASRSAYIHSLSSQSLQNAKHFARALFLAFVIKTKGRRLPSFCFYGGEKEIRTLVGVLAQTRFPVVRLRPTQPSLHADPCIISHSFFKIKTFLKKIIIFLKKLELLSVLPTVLCCFLKKQGVKTFVLCWIVC